MDTLRIQDEERRPRLTEMCSNVNDDLDAFFRSRMYTVGEDLRS